MLKEKIKNFINKKTKGDNKKNIENLVVFLILLIITVIAINMIWSKDEKQSNEEGSSYKVLASKEENSNINENVEYDLQTQLEDILCKMDGIGKVDVLVTYSQTSTVVPIYSETQSTTATEETDSSGGTRKQESSNINKEVITNGNNEALTQTVMLPKVEGAIVIAEGGGNVTTKANIIQAVAAVTGLATYKVQVFEMKS